MLATAAGPAWLLLRRMGLQGGWAALGALCVTMPALVYGYELVGSIKEVVALPMVLAMGVPVVCHRRWLQGGPAGAIPFALVAAGGISALGAGFGAWVLAAVAILAAILFGELLARRQGVKPALLLAAVAAIVGLIFAWPTWIDLSGSLKVAESIASTSNPGPLRVPLRTVQVFGTWLRGSYKQLPVDGHLTITYVLIAVTLLACVLGAVHILRSRLYALAGWLAATLAVWLAITAYATTWVSAKALMLTSPVLMLIAWGGVAALLQASAPRPALRPAAALLALALAGGVFASDAMQYHGSNLAPTMRFEEMASLNARFAGRGPTLFTDFDEYSLYELRDLDVGGPDFIAPPSALAGTEGGYRYPVVLDRLSPADLRAYPLIVTRRDPTANRPPSAYSVIWRGTYYEVWSRRPGAPAAIADIGLSGPPADQCAQIKRLAGLARIDRAHLVAAAFPRARARPSGPKLPPNSLGPPARGVGDEQPRAALGRVHGTPSRDVGAVAPGPDHARGQGGSGRTSSRVDRGPARRQLARPKHVDASHSLAFRRPPSPVGDAWRLRPWRRETAARRSCTASSSLPPKAPVQAPLQVVAPDRWSSLCGHSYEWIEVVRS